MKLSVRVICLIGLFTAVTSVLSIISIPTPWGVPFTLQTFAVALAGFVLAEYGGFSTMLYVLLGFCGVPVYHSMTSGPAVLFGPTGGFLWGFIVMSFLSGIGVGLAQNKTHRRLLPVLFGILGLLLCHLLGTTQFYLVMNRLGGKCYIVKCGCKTSVKSPYFGGIVHLPKYNIRGRDICGE